MKLFLTCIACLLGVFLYAEIRVDKPGYAIRISDDGTKLIGISAKASGKTLAANVDLWEMILRDDAKTGPKAFLNSANKGKFSHKQTDDKLTLQYRSAARSFDIVFYLQDQEFNIQVENLVNTKDVVRFVAVPAKWTFPLDNMKRFVFPSQANWSMGICFLPSFFEKRPENDAIYKTTAAPFNGMQRLFNSTTVRVNEPNSRMQSWAVVTEQGKAFYSPEEQQDLSKNGFLRIRNKQSNPKAFELGLIRNQNQEIPFLIGTQFGGKGYLFQFQFVQQNATRRDAMVESIIFNTMSALRRKSGDLINNKSFVLIDYPNMLPMVNGSDPVSLNINDWRRLTKKYSKKFGIELRTVTNLADLRSVLSDGTVGTILNPYGNVFPSDDAANFGSDLDAVKNFVKKGGIWWEVGSRSFDTLLRKEYFASYDRQGRYPSAAADYACAEYGDNQTVALFGVQPTMRFPYDKERAAIPKAYALRGEPTGATFVHQWVSWVDAKSTRPWNSSHYRVSFKHSDAQQGIYAYEKTLELNRKLEDKVKPEVLKKLKNSMLINFWHDDAASDIRSCKILPKNNIAHFIGALASRFDANYPEHLPPSPHWGTYDDLRELIKVAHDNGHLIMPYTNTTWWLPHENGNLSPSMEKWKNDKKAVMAWTQAGSPMWRAGRTGQGWALNFYHPYVQEASLNVTKEFAKLGCDMIFMDEMGGHPWTYNWNPAEPWPATALDGRISMCWDSSKVIPTATEEGHDRLLNFNTLFCGGTWKTFPNSQFESSRYVNQYRPADWQYWPAFLFIGHDKALFTIHDLNWRFVGFEDISLALGLGYKMKDYLSFKATPERLAWSNFLDAIQKTVSKEYEGQKLLTFRYPLENTDLPYRNNLVYVEYANNVKMVCNQTSQEIPLSQLDLPFDPAEMAFLKKQVLPPYGFYVSTGNGKCGYLNQNGNTFAFAMASEDNAYRASVINFSNCKTYTLPDNEQWKAGEFNAFPGKMTVAKQDGEIALTLPVVGKEDSGEYVFTHYNPDEKPAAVMLQLIKDGAVQSIQGGKVPVNTTVSKPGSPLEFAGDTKLQMTVPQQGESMTFVADVTVGELPKAGFAEIVTRRGCNSILGIDPKGWVIFTMWYANKSTNNQVLSKRRLKAGDTARIAAVVKAEKGQTTISLYIDGQLQNTRTTQQMPYPYNTTLFIGNKFKGSIANLFWASDALSQDKLQN
ncbi:MAG: LamG domain-containing protein [Victivallales bacterium]|jgi:hypothetical protein|nr:LamG domain-containing protein [Victivallales bacterium]